MDTIDKVIALLGEKNIPEPDFYKAIGIDKSTFSRWKKKACTISVKNIVKCADFLGVTADYLMGDINV